MKFNFDFNKNARTYFTISLAILAVIFAVTLIFGVELDIQFKGGSMITYSYEGEIVLDTFEQQCEQLFGTDLSVQQSTDIATQLKTMVVSLPGDESMNADKMADVTAGLQEAFAQNHLKSVEINNVSPSIGMDFLRKSMVALALAMLLMMVYVALRFSKIGGLSAGAMGVVALLHDCLIVFGVFVLFRIPINDNFIAIILTILGFSLNDTVVIYDRIRENRRLYGYKMPVGELVSLSINQSLTRSVNTSIAAIMSMVVVTIIAAMYSVESIFTFSFPLIIGLVSGSYSTICIAGPLWIKWQEHKLHKNPA